MSSIEKSNRALSSPRSMQLLLVVFLALLAIVPFQAQGGPDVVVWRAWIEATRQVGIVTAAAGATEGYPPLTWLLFMVVSSLSDVTDIDTVQALRWSLVAFLGLTSAVFFVWTRNLLLTAVLYISLLLSSVALVYLDVYMAPALLLALWALKQGRIFWFSAFYTLACLTKWQPLILGPFLLAHIICSHRSAGWRSVLAVLIRDAAPPACLLIGGAAILFGRPVLTALSEGINEQYLSGDALNYNWLLTHYLRVTEPGRYGPLIDGVADYIKTADWSVVGFSRLLFWAFYVSTLTIFVRRPQSFDNVLRFLIVGYLSYVTFNTGVHENHLFIPALLSIVLYWVRRSDFPVALILVVFANVNLIVFFGINGAPAYPRVVGLDVALPLSLFAVAFFLVLWAGTCWPKVVSEGPRAWTV